MAGPQHRERVKHFDLAGQAHFLTFSCYRRLQLLSKNRTRLWFLEALAKARIQHAFDLWAWVMMPAQIHLMIYPRQPRYKSSKILASRKKPVGDQAVQFLKEHLRGDRIHSQQSRPSWSGDDRDGLAVVERPGLGRTQSSLHHRGPHMASFASRRLIEGAYHYLLASSDVTSVASRGTPALFNYGPRDHRRYLPLRTASPKTPKQWHVNRGAKQGHPAVTLRPVSVETPKRIRSMPE